MKKIWLWFALFIVILAVGIAGSIRLLKKPTGSIVEIVRDGEVLYRMDLSEHRKTETIEIKYEDGSNRIRIENGKICMSDEDCPDQICVKMGWLQSSAFPIVCLPHHLVIQYADSEGSVDGVVN